MKTFALVSASLVIVLASACNKEDPPPATAQAGVGTIVAMHLSEEHFKCVKDEHINIVIAGHIASDTLGLNLLLDSVEKAGSLNIVPCSGFVRVKR